MENLGYEQLLALRIMRDTPDKEASGIAEEAGCSWDDLWFLCNNGLSMSGRDRIRPRRLHPTITEAGIVAVKSAENNGII